MTYHHALQYASVTVGLGSGRGRCETRGACSEPHGSRLSMSSLIASAMVAAACLAGAAHTNSQHEAPPDGNSLVALHLVAETDGVQPGTTAMLGFEFSISPGWHIYWHGMSDAGFPPSIDLECPAGFAAGSPQWPAPVRHLGAGDVLDHVYEDTVTILVPVEVPKDAKVGTTVQFTASSKWLVCREACVSGSGQSVISLAVVGEAPRKSKSAPRFDASRKRLPEALTAKSGVEVAAADGVLRARASKPGVLRFFPETDCAEFTDLASHGESKTGILELKIEPGPAAARIHGILEYVPAGGGSVYYMIDQRAGGNSPAKSDQK